MSHCPAAQAGHGTGSGRRTIPTDQITALKPRPDRGLENLTQPLVAQHQPGLALRRLSIDSLGDLAVSAAHADQPPDTNSSPWATGGSSSVSTPAVPLRPGVTVIARMIALSPPFATASCARRF